MDKCDYCSSYNAVMWDLEAGDICMECLGKRRAIARQKALDDEEAAEQAERDKYLFWHE